MTKKRIQELLDTDLSKGITIDKYSEEDQEIYSKTGRGKSTKRHKLVLGKERKPLSEG